MISIEVSDVVLNGPLSKQRDVVVSFEGRLRLLCGASVYFEDEFFPIVELAIALDSWRASGLRGRTDFEFDAMSAEELGIVWLRSVGGGWRVGSIWQDKPCVEAITAGQLDDLLSGYISTVRNTVDSVGGPRALEWVDLLLAGST